MRAMYEAKLNEYETERNELLTLLGEVGSILDIDKIRSKISSINQGSEEWEPKGAPNGHQTTG